MQTILETAARREMAWKEMVKENGYEPFTTFYSDFTIAELVSGANGVKDTYKRAVDAWSKDTKYVTELVMVLNHKIFEHYSANKTMAAVYNSLWEKLDNWCLDNLKDEDLKYYIRVLD